MNARGSVVSPKKLIEVALPLPDINDASAYDKRPGIGPHPKGIHHWWARLPLPTARAVLFASVVDDPSAHPDRWTTEESQDVERARLLGILGRMMRKKLHEDPHAYAEAHAEMLKHADGQLPVVFDPFAGGGSIPLEAYRLGFEAHAGDLNPVAVLLNKCSLEMAPRWAGRPPVNPEDRRRIDGKDRWLGTQALAADVRYYGRLIRERAREKIGQFYPRVRLPKTHGGGEASVIAWIWARTVASPDPAAHGNHVPLVSTFRLSSRERNEAWLQPVVDRAKGSWHFDVRTGTPMDRAAIKAGTKNGKGGFTCLLTGAPIPFDYVRDEGRAGRIGFAMLAVVAEGPRSRVYLSPTELDRQAAEQAAPSGYPDTDLPEEALGFRVQNYGIRKHWQMFTPRQLAAMVMLSDLVKTIGADVRLDAQAMGLLADEADAYGTTVTTFLALALGRTTDHNNALCTWDQSSAGQRVKHLFGRQTISMVWDFAEANILGDKSVCWKSAVEITAEAIATLAPINSPPRGSARQVDAARGADGLRNLLVSTDPPYYDNI